MGEEDVRDIHGYFLRLGGERNKEPTLAFTTVMKRAK